MEIIIVKWIFNTTPPFKKLLNTKILWKWTSRLTKWTHWVDLYPQNNNNSVIYFDSFGVEHIRKEIKVFINNKNIKTNIFRVQAYDSIMCGYFYIGFIDFMLAGKTLTEYTNLF